MASPPRRPLPTPPRSPIRARPDQDARSPGVFTFNNPFFSPYAYPPYAPPTPDFYDDEPTTTSVPTGTFLHKGFYDLLAMIPTPSPSRLIWGNPPQTAVAGPRYEDQNPATIRAMPKKGRRVSKDMVSKPTGFVYVVPLQWSRPVSAHISQTRSVILFTRRTLTNLKPY